MLSWLPTKNLLDSYGIPVSGNSFPCLYPTFFCHRIKAYNLCHKVAEEKNTGFVPENIFKSNNLDTQLPNYQFSEKNGLTESIHCIETHEDTIKVFIVHGLTRTMNNEVLWLDLLTTC